MIMFFITINQLLGYNIAFLELTSDFWKNDNVEMTLCLKINVNQARDAYQIILPRHCSHEIHQGRFNIFSQLIDCQIQHNLNIDGTTLAVNDNINWYMTS